MTPESQPAQSAPSSLLPPTDAPMRAFSFLLKAYELSAGEAEGAVPIWDVGSALGIEESIAEAIASDLQEMNLIYYSSLAGDIALTSFGLSEIVLARSLPEQPTTHFPALAAMSEQMMLPLAGRKIEDASDVEPQEASASEPIPDSFSADIHYLADQLAAFKHDLHGSESALHLSRRIDELDDALSECPHWSADLISDLQEIQLELAY